MQWNASHQMASFAFRFCQKLIPARDLPQALLKELTTLPRPSNWLVRGYCPFPKNPIPTLASFLALWVSDCGPLDLAVIPSRFSVSRRWQPYYCSFIIWCLQLSFISVLIQHLLLLFIWLMSCYFEGRAFAKCSSWCCWSAPSSAGSNWAENERVCRCEPTINGPESTWAASDSRWRDVDDVWQWQDSRWSWKTWYGRRSRWRRSCRHE